MSSLDQYCFKGTGIKKPFEKMRANAIIKADNSASGLNMINFNITAFLPRHRQNDAFHILSLWAVEPVRLQKEKFYAHPDAGRDALYKRADILINHFIRRDDMNEDFLQDAMIKMVEAIDNVMGEKTAEDAADIISQTA